MVATDMGASQNDSDNLTTIMRPFTTRVWFLVLDVIIHVRVVATLSMVSTLLLLNVAMSLTWYVNSWSFLSLFRWIRVTRKTGAIIRVPPADRVPCLDSTQYIIGKVTQPRIH
ncbi:hypothetical protein BDN72DRAFT_161764 [Pluteus cervinus]|uniref:Uncharacterized protein n=1 Tax=Pluteus cervinus TaxID=181527 RepID=A0ACD3AK79_9AGAR|nr:hypothetical protein BDN72DRAFT_161764 [Pluteus cervinus]